MNIVETPPASAPLDPAQVKWIGYGIAAVGSITPILILFVGQPTLEVLALVSILLQIMLLGLIAFMPRAFLVSPPRLNSRMINWALIIPVVSLIAAGADAHLVDPRILVVASLVLGLAGAIGAGLTPGASSIPSPIFYVVFVGVFAGGLGWGATALANRAFDLSQGQLYEPVVQYKYTTYGRGTHFHVTLGPWGPIAQSTNIGVSHTLYDQLTPGTPMCARLHAGTLGFAWYKVGSC